jgi:hypothetical protein
LIFRKIASTDAGIAQQKCREHEVPKATPDIEKVASGSVSFLEIAKN